jgi:cbb3-type cytochrome oxidase maturation protein
MSIIYVLIPLSVILMVFAIGFFFWAVRNNQFDDLDTPALDVLDEDDEAPRHDASARQEDTSERTSSKTKD